MISIRVLGEGHSLQEINGLLNNLSSNIKPITEQDLKIYSTTCDLFIFTAVDSDKNYSIVGMATIFFVWKCSGWLAEIHDVVVNPTYSGRHIGDMLMITLLENIKGFAKNKLEKITVCLTSKPHRVAANTMYQKHGFELVAKAEGENGTNLYKLVIEP